LGPRLVIDTYVSENWSLAHECEARGPGRLNAVIIATNN
jgi:hypothetical protein